MSEGHTWPWEHEAQGLWLGGLVTWLLWLLPPDLSAAFLLSSPHDLGWGHSPHLAASVHGRGRGLLLGHLDGSGT